MAELESYGNEGIKKIMLKHGIKEPFFGVKVEHLKIIQKKVKTNYQLALDLYETGNSDAMYLAGLIADDAKMTRADLNNWAQKAVSNNIVEYTVPWVAAGSPLGWELGLEWIQSEDEKIASAGWNTLAGWISLKPDTALDLNMIKELLARIEKEIHGAKNRVRYTMNGFVIAVGSYVSELTEAAKKTGSKIGNVTVDMNGTACKVPDAPAYIQKVADKNKIGVKKKTVKC